MYIIYNNKLTTSNNGIPTFWSDEAGWTTSFANVTIFDRKHPINGGLVWTTLDWLRETLTEQGRL